MSFNDEYLALRKKRKEEEEKAKNQFGLMYQNKTLVDDSSNDIAPVKETVEEKDDRKWFQKGAFEDGYQFGDLTKTIGGTLTDLRAGLMSGLLGIGEKVVDAGAYVVGGVGGLFSDDFKESTQDFIAKDLYDERKIAEKIVQGTVPDFGGNYGMENSVFGDKTDSLLESGGQLLGTVALQAVGVPWYLTSGVTSFGSETENAFNQGATYGQAGGSALISAGAEILTEKMFGGSGLGESGLIDLGKLTGGISNKVVKALADYGLDMAAEGSEEVVSQIFSNLGSALYREENLADILASEEAVDEYIESFIGGAALGGVANVGNAASSIKTGKDYRTGLTESEQTVFDNVYNERIAEAEKDGKKLTNKEKNEIYSEVMEDLEKGRIDIDTIERALGGDTYMDYVNTVNNENELMKEYDELYNLKRSDFTPKQEDRFKELQPQIEAIKKNNSGTLLKEKLSEDVFNLAKDSKLAESYNEKARRSQRFEADLSKYDKTMQETVKKAVESGILNNTNRTHEFVDIIAKISADKGVPFDFTNNAKLKESGFAVDGKTVNGVYTKDGISLNMDSQKAWQTTVGHEITHVLEGTELYAELQNSLFEYAKSKGDYDGRVEALKSLYKGVEGANVDAELTADLVGEYLFTDSDFVNNLSVKNRNVFQKIYDEIKYLWKMVTAGSKEARELEKIKRTFDEAYRKSGTKVSETEATGETKYSLSEDAKKSDADYLDAVNRGDTETAQKMVDDAAEEWSEGKRLYTTDADTGEVLYTFYRSADGGRTVWNGHGNNKAQGVFLTSNEQIANAFDASGKHITVYAKAEKPFEIDAKGNIYTGIPVDESAPEWLQDVAAYEVVYDDEIGDYVDTMYVDIDNLYPAAFKQGYDAVVATNIKEGVGGDLATDIVLKDGGKQMKSADAATYDDNGNVIPLSERFNKKNDDIRYSLSADSEGKQLSKEQSDYFKDSKMRDENGNLKVMYHGSQDAGFHVFDPAHSDDETSLFFVDRNDVAASYSGTTETYEAQSIRTAEDMNNFIEKIGAEGYEVVEENGKFTLLYEGDRVADSKTAKGIYEEFCWYEGVGEGEANYKVYLNLTNPLEVDAEGRNWNELPAIDGSKEEYRYIKVVDVGDVPGQVTIEYAMSGDAAPITETVDLETKFNGWIAQRVSDLAPGEQLEFIPVNPATTRDYAQYARENGYDGVILNNVVDNGGYANGKEGASTVAIAFDSNQIKSVANDKPTKNADIRFSLSKEVEETKDLLVLHNLTESKLLKQLELDGFPMPSLAVTNQPHTNFGSISILFDKDTIDPKKNKKNKTYSADAWTPTFPRIEYEADRDVSQNFVKTLRGLIDDSYYHGSVSSFLYDVDDNLNRNGGYEGLIDYLAKKPAVQYAFLKSKGENIEIAQKAKDVELGFVNSEKWIERYENIIKEFSGDLSNVEKIPFTELIEKSPTLKKLSERFSPNERLRQMGMIGKAIKGAKAYQTYDPNAEVETEFIPDYSQTDKDILERIDDAEIKAWLKEQTKGIVANSGVYNGKEIFTPSGNRRSFKQLHYPVTVENIVKSMASQGEKSVTSFHGVKTLRATTAKTFKSIAEIQKAKGKLQNLSEAEVDQIHDELSNQMYEVFNKIIGENPKMFRKDDIFALDTIGEVLSEVEYENINASYIKGVFNKYGYNISSETADDCFKLLDAISSMPVYIFEAKPQRVVGYDEIKAVVIPDNTSVELKNALTERGISFVEYDGTEADRQAKLNEVATANDSYFSLSWENEAPIRLRGDVPMSDLRLETEDVAPVQEDVAKIAKTTPTVSKMEQVEDYAPVTDEKTELEKRIEALGEEWEALEQERESISVQASQGTMPYNDAMARLEEIKPRYNQLVEERNALIDKVIALEKAENAMQKDRLDSLTDADAPPEMEAPYGEENTGLVPDDPFENRKMKEVSKNRKVKAYMYENPEVKPFFQAEANVLLGEYERTEKPETIYNGWLKYDLPYEFAQDIPTIYRTSRVTSPDIAYLRDTIGMSYADIEKGLKAILEDNGAENIAAAKKIEFVLNNRLLNGYRDFDGYDIPPNQDYINLLNEKQIREYSEEARSKFFEASDQYAPPADDDIAPVAEQYEAIKPKKETSTEPRLKRVKEGAPSATYETAKKGQVEGQRTMFAEGKTAEILTEEPNAKKKGNGAWAMFKNNVLDKGMVFEDLSLETGNRELQARWNSIRYAEGKAQKLIGEGNANVSSLKSIQETVENSGKTKQFYEYLYHKHNVDRMSLEAKAGLTIGGLRSKFGHLQDAQIKAIAAKEITDKTTEKTAQTILEAREYLKALETKNKPVFGDSVTAEVSQEVADRLEKANPEFKGYAQEVYNYMNYLREMLVDGGVVSSDTAKLWSEMYPHYVPIRRDGQTGLNINVPLDTGKTGVNAPIKRATGGNSDILPLFDTMALRTEQTYKAIAKNRFGVELKNTLGTTIADEATSLDDAIESVEAQDGLLQEGKNGKSPTFTVFENGKKVTFEITEEMYDAIKPTSKGLSYTNKIANTVGNVFRGLLTEYNPVFMTTNAVKDAQDVLINSQHAAKTYASIPKAITQMATGGHWYQEYLENGGEQNTYFDNQTKTFKAEDKGIKKLIGMPLRAISHLNNTIEKVPRLAEYIASRESGASVDVAMLDAARVTTNFAAGGDVTKALNRNGFNFLNASMQGAVQQVRNVREAKANGLKGWMQLATKVAIAGVPAMILNNLLWDDDEEYEELSDYVKQNYYVVAKFGDGQFVRIPKGRTLAVIQNAMEQTANALTGDDEFDLQSFLELAISNLAPNNPLENNIIAPIMQVKNNETWYGEDLVPTRLQDLPEAEQFDESTDALSKWLGEKLDYSPYKINYLLNQYSGGVGDVVLPMLTPEAESGDNSILGNVIAPFKDKFTTDSVMNNQNVSDFYDTVDELTANANSSYATDEDLLKYKYMNAVNSELSDLYKQKREIQNSDLSDDEKYEAVRDIQQQIVDLAKNGLSSYEDIRYEGDGEYALIGDKYFQWYTPENGESYWRKLNDDQVVKYNLTKNAGDSHYVTDGNVHYRLDDDGAWTKISDRDLERQNEVTKALGITPDEYWRRTDITYVPLKNGEYEYAFDNPEKYEVAKAVGGYDAYKTYSSELYEIKADKDENGKSISGSRKEKVFEYINNLDIDYGAKLILFKSEYNADDTYNYEIIDYLNSREDISYEGMEAILKELGFTVKSDGTITWD